MDAARGVGWRNRGGGGARGGEGGGGRGGGGGGGQWWALAAGARAWADRRRDGAPVIVARPIGVDDVVARRAPTRLAAVDIGADGGAGVMRHAKAVGAAAAAAEQARVLGAVLRRGEQPGLQGHPRQRGTTTRAATVHTGLRNRQRRTRPHDARARHGAAGGGKYSVTGGMA